MTIAVVVACFLKGLKVNAKNNPNICFPGIIN